MVIAVTPKETSSTRRNNNLVRLFVADPNTKKNKDEVQLELSKTDATIETLQQFLGKVSALSEQLTIMEGKLRDNRREWMKEKNLLTRKISLLTTLLKEQNEKESDRKIDSSPTTPAAAVDNTEAVMISNETVSSLERDLRISYEREEELVYEQERLEREVGILQDQIVQFQNMYRTEQYKTEELIEAVEEYQTRDGDWESLCNDQERQIAELQATVKSMEEEQLIVKNPEQAARSRRWEDSVVGLEQQIMQLQAKVNSQEQLEQPFQEIEILVEPAVAKMKKSTKKVKQSS